MKPTLVVALLLSFVTFAPAYAADQPAMAAAQPTCGQMTAGMAAIPEKLAMGAMSVAEMEEAHAKFMSANKDKASQAEVKGLRELAQDTQTDSGQHGEGCRRDEEGRVLAGGAARHGQDEG